MKPTELGAMLLFSTQPTDRALIGWYPYEAKMLTGMTEEQVNRWISDEEDNCL